MKDKSSKIFKALAHPTRRKILLTIQRYGMNVNSIVKAFNVSQPAISHHLRILANAELLASERCGKEIWYYINKATLKKAYRDYFRKFRGISR